MHTRKLGGLEVSAIGLGCMNMSEFYGPPNPEAGIETIHRALEVGVTLLDTSDMYGPFTNEELIGRAIAGKRDGYVVATKCGVDRRDGRYELNGRPDYIPQACDDSLKRLGVDHIDLYQLHRKDPNVPLEDSVGAMGELVKAGKVRHIGLSEVGPNDLRKANAVHKISSLQTEYSLYERSVEAEVLPVCRELGIGFLCYSPLGRGLLTGRYRSVADFGDQDVRAYFGRSSGDALEHNLKMLEPLEQLAEAKDCSMAQLALAWLLASGDDIVPIPGTGNAKRLEQNAGAVDVDLSQDDREKLATAFQVGATQGLRYPEGMVPEWD